MKARTILKRMLTPEIPRSTVVPESGLSEVRPEGGTCPKVSRNVVVKLTLFINSLAAARAQECRVAKRVWTMMQVSAI